VTWSAIQVKCDVDHNSSYVGIVIMAITTMAATLKFHNPYVIKRTLLDMSIMNTVLFCYTNYIHFVGVRHRLRQL